MLIVVQCERVVPKCVRLVCAQQPNRTKKAWRERDNLERHADERSVPPCPNLGRRPDEAAPFWHEKHFAAVRDAHLDAAARREWAVWRDCVSWGGLGCASGSLASSGVTRDLVKLPAGEQRLLVERRGDGGLLRLVTAAHDRTEA